jgi:hypothetical protein
MRTPRGYEMQSLLGTGQRHPITRSGLWNNGEMALDIDTRRALRGLPDLRRLVEAVVAAGEHDEAEWIEWKSTLDLTTKHGQFHVARTVLGMANRLPERAAAVCEGVGYIVVGAEPGSRAGIASVDLADLDASLEHYLGGSEGPRFTPTYVNHGDATVLVVVVEPPSEGDPIFPLRRALDPCESGAIFVRKRGRTARADAKDIRALQTRLLASLAPAAEMKVSLVGDLPLPWFEASKASSLIGSWVARRRRTLIAAAEEEERRRNTPVDPSKSSLTGLGLLGKSYRLDMMRVTGLVGNEDDRTIEQYLAEVEKWADGLATVAEAALPTAYMAAGHGAVAVRVRNPGKRFLNDVEVEIHFGWDRAVGVDDEPVPLRMPTPPRAYGERKPAAGLAGLTSMATTFPSVRALGQPPRRTWVEDGSVRLRFRVGDLRPRGQDTGRSSLHSVARSPGWRCPAGPLASDGPESRWGSRRPIRHSCRRRPN